MKPKITFSNILEIKNKHNMGITEKKYDTNYKPSKKDIQDFPDLQNGPSNLINGSPVFIQHVGSHNFRLPIKFKKKNGEIVQLETRVTGTVSLDANKKGINMSRIMRTFYKFKDDIIFDNIENILSSFKQELDASRAKLYLNFSYPIILNSLRSNNEGYQYYNVSYEADIDEFEKVKKKFHFDFVYSSACPCSYELSEHAREHRNKATVAHSQRSVARISIETEDNMFIEDIHLLCANALKTETQVMVKREDEMAFAELNGSYLKFVEDAVRLIFKELNSHKNILDFRIICSHQESLHSHDAVSVLLAPNSKFNCDISHETWSSLIHKS